MPKYAYVFTAAGMAFSGFGNAVMAAMGLINLTPTQQAIYGALAVGFAVIMAIFKK
jgi:hypothetical protein